MRRIKRKILPITFILSLTTQAQAPLAPHVPEVKTRYFYANGGESLKDFLRNKVGIPQKTLTEMGYLEKIRDWNPNIENFNSLSSNQRVYVEIPFNTVLSPKVNSNSSLAQQAPTPVAPITPVIAAPAPTPELDLFLDEEEEEKVEELALTEEPQQEEELVDEPKRAVASVAPVENTSVQEVEFQKPEAPNSWNLSLFYTLSRGSFEESIQGTNISTVSTQDSPITLGLAASKVLNENWGYNGSVYGSKLDGGVSELDEEVSIPWELGVTSYLSYRTPELPFSVYTGLDYERFSTYNTTELVEGASLDTIQHNVAFATFGVSKGFRFLGKSFFAKASYSRTIASTVSREMNGDTRTMEGSKYILYLNMLANKNWFYSLFYKQHDFSGATDLLVSRVGVGFGYRF